MIDRSFWEPVLIIAGVLSTGVFFGSIFLMVRNSISSKKSQKALDIESDNIYIDNKIKKDCDLADKLLTDLIMKADREATFCKGDF